VVPNTVKTVGDLLSFFQKEHNATMTSWTIRSSDDMGRRIYPPAREVDPALLPSFDLTMPQATQQIMSNKQITEKQKYLEKWKALKALQGQGAAAAEANPEEALLKTELRDVLQSRGKVSLAKRILVELGSITLERDGVDLETPVIVYNLS
jgi:hypothetical protein